MLHFQELLAPVFIDPRELFTGKMNALKAFLRFFQCVDGWFIKNSHRKPIFSGYFGHWPWAQ
jgi:hypothetical protein